MMPPLSYLPSVDRFSCKQIPRVEYKVLPLLLKNGKYLPIDSKQLESLKISAKLGNLISLKVFFREEVDPEKLKVPVVGSKLFSDQKLTFLLLKKAQETQEPIFAEKISAPAKKVAVFSLVVIGALAVAYRISQRVAFSIPSVFSEVAIQRPDLLTDTGKGMMADDLLADGVNVEHHLLNTSLENAIACDVDFPRVIDLTPIVGNSPYFNEQMEFRAQFPSDVIALSQEESFSYDEENSSPSPLGSLGVFSSFSFHMISVACAIIRSCAFNFPYWKGALILKGALGCWYLSRRCKQEVNDEECGFQKELVEKGVLVVKEDEELEFSKFLKEAGDLEENGSSDEVGKMKEVYFHRMQKKTHLSQEAVKTYQHLLLRLEKWFSSKEVVFPIDQKIVLLKLLQDGYREDGQNLFEEKLRVLIRKIKLIERGVFIEEEVNDQLKVGEHDLLPMDGKYNEWSLIYPYLKKGMEQFFLSLEKIMESLSPSSMEIELLSHKKINQIFDDHSLLLKVFEEEFKDFFVAYRNSIYLRDYRRLEELYQNRLCEITSHLFSRFHRERAESLLKAFSGFHFEILLPITAYKFFELFAHAKEEVEVFFPDGNFFSETFEKFLVGDLYKKNPEKALYWIFKWSQLSEDRSFKTRLGGRIKGFSFVLDCHHRFYLENKLHNFVVVQQSIPDYFCILERIRELLGRDISAYQKILLLETLSKTNHSLKKYFHYILRNDEAYTYWRKFFNKINKLSQESDKKAPSQWNRFNRSYSYRCFKNFLCWLRLELKLPYQPMDPIEIDKIVATALKFTYLNSMRSDKKLDPHDLVFWGYGENFKKFRGGKARDKNKVASVLIALEHRRGERPNDPLLNDLLVYQKKYLTDVLPTIPLNEFPLIKKIMRNERISAINKIKILELLEDKNAQWEIEDFDVNDRIQLNDFLEKCSIECKTSVEKRLFADFKKISRIFHLEKMVCEHTLSWVWDWPQLNEGLKAIAPDREYTRDKYIKKWRFYSDLVTQLKRIEEYKKADADKLKIYMQFLAESHRIQDKDRKQAVFFIEELTLLVSHIQMELEELDMINDVLREKIQGILNALNEHKNLCLYRGFYGDSYDS